MGIFLTNLADVIRAAGLTVVEVPGWQTRGWRGPTSPDGGLVSVTGLLAHHTGTPSASPGDYPSLGVVRDGRSDVPGPLAQLGLGRSGTVYVIAAGRANHSGAVDDSRYSNPYALGIEAEHPGGTAPWPPAQYAAYVRLVRALVSAYRLITPRGHKEAAIPYGRKPDPNFDMNRFRADVSGGGAVTTEDDMFNDTDRYALNLILGAAANLERNVYALSQQVAGSPVDVDEEKIAATILASLTPEKIAGAIPAGLAGQVADELAKRLAA